MLIGSSNRVSESKLRSAAGRLMRQGLRPTVERVRQELGGGAPDVLGGMLDRWFRDLAVCLDAKKDVGLPAPMPKDMGITVRQSGTQRQAPTVEHRGEVHCVARIATGDSSADIGGSPSPSARQGDALAFASDLAKEINALRDILDLDLRSRIKGLECQLSVAKRREESKDNAYQDLWARYLALIGHATTLECELRSKAELHKEGLRRVQAETESMRRLWHDSHDREIQLLNELATGAYSRPTQA